MEELLRGFDVANCAHRIESREEIQAGENLRPTFKGYYFTTGVTIAQQLVGVERS